MNTQGTAHAAPNCLILFCCIRAHCMHHIHYASRPHASRCDKAACTKHVLRKCVHRGKMRIKPVRVSGAKIKHFCCRSERRCTICQRNNFQPANLRCSPSATRCSTTACDDIPHSHLFVSDRQGERHKYCTAACCGIHDCYDKLNPAGKSCIFLFKHVRLFCKVLITCGTATAVGVLHHCCATHHCPAVIWTARL